MSYDKVSKSLKRYRDAVAVQNQLTICKHYDAAITRPTGLFRKQHALNCGRSGCFMCTNPRRRFKQVTMQEHKANQAFRYDLLFV